MLGVFIDIETNGLNPTKHRVLEIACKLVDLLTGVEYEAYESLHRLSYSEWAEGNEASIKISALNWIEISQATPTKTLSSEIMSLFEKYEIQRGKAVFIGQNVSFDRAFFAQLVPPEIQEERQYPYHWLDLASMYWGTKVHLIKYHGESPSQFPWITGFSKDQIAAASGLPPEASPHRAMNGVNHLLLCYEQVVGFPQKGCQPEVCDEETIALAEEIDPQPSMGSNEPLLLGDDIIIPVNWGEASPEKTLV